MSTQTIVVTFVAVSDTDRTITITINGQGTVMVMPKKDIYKVGESVSLYAVPATGWTFSGFSGAVNSTANPTTFTVT